MGIYSTEGCGMKINRRLNRCLLAGLLAAFAGSASAGTNFYWSNPAGGTFNTITNWSPNGLPTGTDSVFFNLNSIYTVTLSSSLINQAIDVQRDNLTLSVAAGQTYTVNGAIDSMIVGDTADIGQFTLSGAMVANNAIIGKSAPSKGIVTLNPGASLATAALQVGYYGAAELYLQNASSLTSTSIVVGANGGTLSAPNYFSADHSTIHAPSGLTIGQNGVGKVELFNASSAQVGPLALGSGATGNGFLSLAGGSFLSASTFTTGPGVSAADIQESSTLTVGNANLDGAWNSALDEPIYFGGSTFNVTNSLQIGLNGSYAVKLDSIAVGDEAVRSALNAGSVSIGGEMGTVTGVGTGALVIVDSAAAISGPLHVGVGGNGKLSLDQVSTLSSASATVGDGAEAEGLVSLTGASSWTNAGAFIVGNGENSMGTVSLVDTSKLVTGTIASPIQAYIGKNGAGSVSLTDEGTDWTHHGDLLVGQGVYSQGSLVVNNAAALTVENLYVAGNGAALGGIGSVTLGEEDGVPGGSVTVNQNAEIGRGGWGVIDIYAGGSFHVKGDLSVGVGNNASLGNIAVKGAAATLKVDGTTRVGQYGTGGLIIQDSAVFTSGPAFIGGADGFGYINVNSSGKWNATGNVVVGKTVAGPINDGTLSIDGGSVTISGSLSINAGGLLTLSNATLMASGISLNGGAIQGSGIVIQSINATGGNISADSAALPLTLAGPLTTSGNINKNGQGILVITGLQTHTVKNTLSVNEGVVRLMTDPKTNLSLLVQPGASLEFGSNQHVDQLTLKAGYVDPYLGNVPGAKAVSLASGNRTIFLNGLSIETTSPLPASFDLKNNDLVIQYTDASPYDQIRQWIASNALTTSTSTGVLAPFDNSRLHKSQWNGLSLSGYNQILVVFALAGDANLDGQVTDEDYLSILANLNHPGNWLQGDLNYDGIVNLTDLGIVTSHLGSGTLAMGDSSIPSSSQIVMVPEPSSLSLLALAGGVLLRRKRK